MPDKNLTTFLTEWGGQVKELIEPSPKVIFGTPTPLTNHSSHAVNFYNAWEDRGRTITIPFTFTGNIAPDSINTTIMCLYSGGIDGIYREEYHPTPDSSGYYLDPYAGVLSIISSNSGEIQFKINDHAYNDRAILTHTIFINNQGFTCEPITIRFED